MDAGCAAELGDEEGSLAALGGGGHDVRGAQEHPTVVHRNARPDIQQCRVNGCPGHAELSCLGSDQEIKRRFSFIIVLLRIS